MTNERPRWSQDVTRTSNALVLEPGVFTWPDPVAIARSLKQSAERSERCVWSWTALPDRRLAAGSGELAAHPFAFR